MYNKTIMMGRLTRDPELRTTTTGKTVCSFSIAVERRFKNADGERVTDFFNVCAWDKTAELVHSYFSKGRMILVEGEMQTRQYTNKEGNPATWYEIVADRVSFTGEKKDDAPTMQASAPRAAAPARQQASLFDPADDLMPDASDDDYPF